MWCSISLGRFWLYNFCDFSFRNTSVLIVSLLNRKFRLTIRNRLGDYDAAVILRPFHSFSILTCHLKWQCSVHVRKSFASWASVSTTSNFWNVKIISGNFLIYFLKKRKRFRLFFLSMKHAVVRCFHQLGLCVIFLFTSNVLRQRINQSVCLNRRVVWCGPTHQRWFFQAAYGHHILA